MPRFRSSPLATSVALASFVVPLSTLWAADEKPVEPINGIDLSGWKTKGEASKSHWTLGKASLKPADLTQVEVAPGGKELINSAAGGVDIYTEQKFADVHIEIEVMIPKGSNSGIYLMGEYEIQVLDSFGKEQPTQQDMGAVYSVSPPKVNAAKEPGEWQKYEIDFLAPRFDGEKRTAAARFLKVVLNGQTIQENVDMPGPTPGGLMGKETPAGPLLLQGDHGAVAYRNLKITPRTEGK
ncbi:MAG TPA: DUF1080 domain-containing protein [Pirellulales bacterium]|nr:DUF1080 domain-containing protein [Pirellulales bacterium]